MRIAADPATQLPQYNVQRSVLATAQRVPFARTTLELQYGDVVGQFDQLADAKSAALRLSEGSGPAVVISSFREPLPGFVEQKPFVLYDADYALMTRPWNPIEKPVIVESGDYHHGRVMTFGFESDGRTTDPGAAQFVVDNGTVHSVEDR